jgi:LysM repeat protein
MPRTTTCRSSLFAGFLAATAAAYPAAAFAQQAERPPSHTVSRGDTLWDLARRYLGDPFLWSQIYRLNTGVVEDPHWIYPGEVLKLVPEPGAQAVPSEEPAAPSEPPAEPAPREQAAEDYEYPMPAFAQRRPPEVTEALRRYVDESYRPLRPGEFYSSGFLTEGRELPFGSFLGTVTPQQVRSLSESSSAAIHAAVAVTAPEGTTYAAGDTLLVAQTFTEYEGFGTVVVPTGLVRVTGQDQHQTLGEVIAVYATMRMGQLVLPVEPFIAGAGARAVSVTNGAAGEILGGRELRELKHPQNVVFINVGSTSGVAAGDLFEVRRRPGPRPGAADAIDELMATGQVVHVGERSATLRLLQVVSPDIPPGTPARQVGRLPR